MLVTVDKNDFVISISREMYAQNPSVSVLSSNSATPNLEFADSAMAEIDRSDAMPEATQICKGPWHYRSGKGTELSLSAFDMNRNRPDKRNQTCTECLIASKKRKAEPRPKSAASLAVPMRHEGNPPLPVVVLDTPGGLQHKWEVTIIKATVVTVYAKDYLDVGVEAGDGEVINVRRID